MRRIVLVAIVLSLSCRRSPPPKPSTLEDPLLPGIGSPSEPFDRELRAAIAGRGASYKPRTRHLNRDGDALYVNRLIRETSPYLLQHAHNPVNWYAWGDDAFERAKREGRLVLLSIGYSTCHWCHVMERESFEDEEVARYLNEHFVAIKVDREERPDVDGVYMSAVQAMTGRGGWPMTVLLTADRRPFFGGSYLPREQFLAILREMVELQARDPGSLVAQGDTVVAHLARVAARPPPSDVPGPDAIVDAVQRQVRGFDPVHGGFGRAPKFPRPAALELLLHYYRRTQDAGALRVVTTTLERMAAGGIRDQLGGGFHRYATDAAWLVPHFEQMLYDNAQLAILYLDAHQATGREEFAEVATGILDYVLRDLTSPEGLFYSATDADSPTPDGGEEEGRFFTWTPAEIEAAAGPHAAALIAYYGVTAAGHVDGRSVLHVAGAPTSASDLAEGRRRLLAARGSRPRPHRDDKIVTSWNGLAISALSRGALVLDRSDYAAAARRAADRLLAAVRGTDGRLRRTYSGGEARHPATLDDCAFVIQGLLDLFDATSEPRWLDEALALQRQLDTHYLDRIGGYYMTADDAELLLIREKPTYDGAEPSGNSVALLNLLRLDTLTGDARWRQRAEAGLGAFAGDLLSGTASPKLLVALDRYHDSPLEVILVASRDRADLAPLLGVVRRTYAPNAFLVAATDGAELDEIARIVRPADTKRALRDEPTAFVCERGSCQMPTGDPAVLAAQLARPRPLLADRSPPALSVP